MRDKKKISFLLFLSITMCLFIITGCRGIPIVSEVSNLFSSEPESSPGQGFMSPRKGHNEPETEKLDEVRLKREEPRSMSGDADALEERMKEKEKRTRKVLGLE